MLALDEQSPNIAAGVHINRSIEDLGAGDQVKKYLRVPKIALITTLCTIFFFFSFLLNYIVYRWCRVSADRVETHAPNRKRKNAPFAFFLLFFFSVIASF